MKYKGKDLVEITTSQIINPPREMLVWNGDMAKRNKEPQKETVYAVVKIGIRYVAITSSYQWEFCAEIPKEPNPRRATNRELARWCVQGNGENTDGCRVYHVHCYPKAAENNEVSESIVVRKWNDAGWHEPTVDYMEIEKSPSDSNVLTDSEMHAVDMPKYLETHYAKIGSRTWMSDNLAVTDGGNGIYRNKDNGEYYYTWEAAKRIAGKIPGWHLPSGAEWDELDNATGNDAANLRAKSWNGAREGSWFAAVPAGHWYNGFNNVGSVAYFWTSEPEGMNSAWYRGIDSGTKMYREVASHCVGFSVRLVKNKLTMQYTEQCEKKIAGDYTVFLCNGEEIYRFNHLQTSMFVGKPGCMTEEEHGHAIELCLKDRFEGGWKGDILNPVPWRRDG